jgi:hypothetical protein
VIRTARLLAVLAGLGMLLLALPVAAQATNPGRTSSTATLTVLAGTVQRVPAGQSALQPAASGATLGLGDRVLTAAGATALITFLDGTTVTVQPGADVQVTRADLGKTSSRIGIRINLGAVWARVVRLVDADSGLSLESSTATATVHTGLIGGQQDADGTFVCWTQSPGMTVSPGAGRQVVLQPGQRATVKPGQDPVLAPFRVNRSVLRVTTPAGLLPLVVMPDRARVAGFVAPGVEVNQVFGSRTGVTADGGRGVEVPAGTAGGYQVVVEGQRGGEAMLGWAVLFDGQVVYQQATPLTLERGTRLTTTITPEHEGAGQAEPRTARVTGAGASPIHRFAGDLPGHILLSPDEVAAASR